MLLNINVDLGCGARCTALFDCLDLSGSGSSYELTNLLIKYSACFAEAILCVVSPDLNFT